MPIITYPRDEISRYRSILLERRAFNREKALSDSRGRGQFSPVSTPFDAHFVAFLPLRNAFTDALDLASDIGPQNRREGFYEDAVRLDLPIHGVQSSGKDFDDNFACRGRWDFSRAYSELALLGLEVEYLLRHPVWRSKWMGKVMI